MHAIYLMGTYARYAWDIIINMGAVHPTLGHKIAGPDLVRTAE